MGRYAEALTARVESGKCFRRALDLRPDDPQRLGNWLIALEMQGWLLVVLGRRAEGLERLEEVDARWRSAALPLGGWDHYRLAYLALAKDRQEDWEQELRQAIALGTEELARSPGEAWIAFNLALYRLASGEEQADPEIYRRTKATNRDWWDLAGAILDLRALGVLLGEERVREALGILGFPPSSPPEA